MRWLANKQQLILQLTRSRKGANIARVSRRNTLRLWYGTSAMCAYVGSSRINSHFARFAVADLLSTSFEVAQRGVKLLLQTAFGRNSRNNITNFFLSSAHHVTTLLLRAAFHSYLSVVIRCRRRTLSASVVSDAHCSQQTVDSDRHFKVRPSRHVTDKQTDGQTG
jgi:hypothetical protein